MKKPIPFLPAALVLSLVYVGVFSWIVRSHVMDDAYISFRYVSNIISGNGLTFNPGERVEGISNIGWAVFLVPFSLIIETPLAAKLVGLALALAVIVLTTVIASHTVEINGDYIKRAVMLVPIPLFVATQFDFLYFSQTGMETGLIAFLFSVIIYLSITARSKVLIAFLSAILWTMHPECVLVFPFFLALAYWGRLPSCKQYLTPAIVFIAVIGMTILARYYYYDALLPNTFVAKATPLHYILGRIVFLLAGNSPNIPVPFSGIMGISLMALGVSSVWRRCQEPACFMIAIVLCGFTFGLYSRGDWTHTARYFAPYVAVAFILLWQGAVRAVERLFPSQKDSRVPERVLWLLALAIIIISVGISAEKLRPQKVQDYPGFVMAGSSLVQPSLWIRDNLPDGSTIATSRIGAISYYSNKIIFDNQFGLTNKEIAEKRRQSAGKLFMFGDPAVEELVRKVCPEYLSHSFLAWPRMEIPQCEQFYGMRYCLVNKWKVGTRFGVDEWWLIRRRASPDCKK
ncbi:MAG: hypothetical protein WCO26_09675 [Deltaproteobacteria bacterium]